MVLHELQKKVIISGRKKRRTGLLSGHAFEAVLSEAPVMVTKLAMAAF
jgi:hypothetical protein